MAENMMCSTQKASSKAFRDNFDRIFKSYDAYESRLGVDPGSESFGIGNGELPIETLKTLD